MAKKTLSILLLFLCLVSFSYALDYGYVGESTRIWGDVILDNDLADVDNVTLTLYNANGSIVYNQTNMTKLSAGLYYIDFTPNVSGIYLAVAMAYNASSLIGTGTDTIGILNNETQNTMILALLIGLIGLGFLASYISHNIQLEEVPRGRIIEKALYYTLGFVFLLGTPIFMLTIVENNPTLNYLEPIASTSVIVTTLIGFAILIFYFVYHMKKQLERLNKAKEQNENDLEK